jgi:outer membrane protein assembly factor BamA
MPRSLLSISRLPAVFLLGCLLSSLSLPLRGQAFVERITQFFEFPVGHPGDSSVFQNKLVLAPVATYEPATSLGLGIGAKFLFKPKGVAPNTRTSNLPISLLYTLRNQFIFYSGYTVFFDQERYLLKGNLELSQFPLSYFGLGNRSTQADKLEIAYGNILVQPLLLRQLRPKLFAGGGIRYNSFRNVKVHETIGDLIEGTSLQDSLGSTSVGLEFALTLDDRDNVLNASEGRLVEFSHGFYERILGGTHRYMLTRLDYRKYWKIWSQRADILAIQTFGRLSWRGAPALDHSALGGPERLRGYQEGRFRDRLAVFAQAEYRWQALERIGFVFFAGAGEVADRLDGLSLKQLKYSLGTGLRLKIVESENLNIRFDYALGLGSENDRNFYLGIAESF